MKYDFSLLFNGEMEQDLKQINQGIKRNEMILTTQQLKVILASRGKALQDSHLLELALETQKYLAAHLSESAFVTPNNYFSDLLDLQELFYFIRSDTAFSWSDQDILDKMLTVFEKYEGSIPHIQGYFEEWLVAEKLTGGSLNEPVDE
ncbi:DUF6323 family protein [Enterococcus sp. LJL51]|uniref:DUF6323 family protein n=1 Tax=Enterococcus sp. LJL51 TaxID=3416656 RepID=UPI003CE6B071